METGKNRTERRRTPKGTLHTSQKRGKGGRRALVFSCGPHPLPAPHGRTLNRGLALLVFRWQKIEAFVLHSWTQIYPQTWRDTLQGATNKTPTKKRRPRRTTPTRIWGGCGHQQSTGANTNFHHIETESAFVSSEEKCGSKSL